MVSAMLHDPDPRDETISRLVTEVRKKDRTIMNQRRELARMKKAVERLKGQKREDER